MYILFSTYYPVSNDDTIYARIDHILTLWLTNVINSVEENTKVRKTHCFGTEYNTQNYDLMQNSCIPIRNNLYILFYFVMILVLSNIIIFNLNDCKVSRMFNKYI
jgi:hypothetical protein